METIQSSRNETSRQEYNILKEAGQVICTIDVYDNELYF